MMAKLLLNLTGLAVALGVGILVMIFGWGLEPVSWGWILGGSLAGVFIGAMIQAAT